MSNLKTLKLNFSNKYYPKNKDLINLLEIYFDAFFYNHNKKNLDKFYKLLFDIIEKILQNDNVKKDNVKLKNNIKNNISQIKQTLIIDANFILETDPASKSIEEIILCYPGFYAIAIYRLSHILNLFEIPIIGRMLSELAHSKTGIDIHPSAKIGSPFFIDHGTGIVIGETTIIGNKVKIYQGVTLGALQINKCDATSKRHPTIEDEVILYANSCVLGGNTIIRKGSIIGANTFITKSIPKFSKVYIKINIENK